MTMNRMLANLFRCLLLSAVLSAWGALPAQADSVTLVTPAHGEGPAIPVGRTEEVKVVVRYDLVTTPMATLTLKAGLDGVVSASEVFELEAGQGLRETVFPMHAGLGDTSLFVVAELLPEGAPAPVVDRVERSCAVRNYKVKYLYNEALLVNGDPVPITLTFSLPDGTLLTDHAFRIATAPAGEPFEADGVHARHLNSHELVTDGAGTATFSYFPPTFDPSRTVTDAVFPLERGLVIEETDTGARVDVALKITGQVPTLAIPELLVLASRQADGGTTPQAPFSHSQPQLFIRFAYRGFPSPGVVNVDLYNGSVHLQQIPVVLLTPEGSKEVEMRRPAQGWDKGTYRVTIQHDQKELKAASFVIKD